MAQNFKYQRLATDLQRVIGTFISEKIEELDFVTVTHVELTKDLGDAKIYVETLGTQKPQKIIDVLQKNENRIKREISNKVEIRRIPNLIFMFDESLDNYNKIEKILTGKED
ncbi:MAG: 30S ribosome-binding factor RbfA [Mycoplasmatales bacterium]